MPTASTTISSTIATWVNRFGASTGRAASGAGAIASNSAAQPTVSGSALVSADIVISWAAMAKTRAPRSQAMAGWASRL
jgi:hypothetical protein